jgi:hypothetical protein
MQSEGEGGANYSNNKSYHFKLETLEEWIICMSYLWFEWTQDDRLSKIYKDAKEVPRKNGINLRWKNGN